MTDRKSLPRIAMLALGGVLALIASQQTALAYWRGLAPQLPPERFAQDPALKVFANDYRLAQYLTGADIPATDRQQMQDAARAAISASPLNAAAMRQLGILADPSQTSDAGTRYFTVAEGISRRDLGAQLALINAAIIGEDLDRVLLHYDRALRVYEAAKPLLFPALMAASRQVPVQDALLGYARSPWFVPFVAQLLNSPGKRGDLGAFLVKAQLQLAAADADKLSGLMLGRMLRDGQYNDAKAWLERSEPNLVLAMNEIGFVPATTNPKLGAFAWSFANRQNVVVALAEGQSLAISTDGGEQELVAERITLLPPAIYQFSADLVASPDTQGAQLVWELRCETTGPQSPGWRFSPDPSSGRHSYPSRLVLTQACRVQHWTLSIRARDPRSLSSIRITGMTLKPVQNER